MLTCIPLFQISTISGELRYGDAMRLLYTLEEATKGFVLDKNFHYFLPFYLFG